MILDGTGIRKLTFLGYVLVLALAVTVLPFAATTGQQAQTNPKPAPKAEPAPETQAKPSPAPKATPSQDPEADAEEIAKMVEDGSTFVEVKALPTETHTSFGSCQ